MVELFATDKLKTLYPKVKAFLEKEIYPIELQLVHGPWLEAKERLDNKRAIAKTLGLWAPYLSEKEGGIGLSMIEFGQISELLGTSPVGHYALNCPAPDIGNIELMHQSASND